MTKKAMATQQLTSLAGYDKIIQINVPIRFYWADGKFDGIEIGPIPDGTTAYQHRLIREVTNQIMALMELAHNCIKYIEELTPKADIPQAFLEAFDNKETGK